MNDVAVDSAGAILNALKTEETVYEQLAGMFYGLGILGYSGLLISGIVKGFFKK